MYIRVLVAQHDEQWLARSVDFNVGAQGPTAQLAVTALVRIVRAHYHRDVEAGRTPFAGLPAVPQEIVNAWEQLVQTKSRVIRAEDGDQMPDAYIIEAIAKKGSAFNLGR